MRRWTVAPLTLAFCNWTRCGVRVAKGTQQGYCKWHCVVSAEAVSDTRPMSYEQAVCVLAGGVTIGLKLHP